MIYSKKPADFKSKFDIVSCFLEYRGEILLLHRQDHKPQGDTWGVPTGKVHEGETLLGTMLRELYEETGHKALPKDLTYFGKVYVRFPDYDFIFHIFHSLTEHKPKITIHPEEHKDFVWVTPQAALSMNLMQDEDTCIKLFYKL